MLTRLRELRELVKRRVQQCCITIMDFDHFKAINDTYGHSVGDQVLSTSVRYVMEHLRPYDKVFRYGGEEFLISMPNTDLEVGLTVIERIREGLSAIVFAQDSPKPLFVTASFGLILLSPDLSVEDSIDRADKALYLAKTTGRNRAQIWDPSIARK
jgi:diguanylate cyclase